MNYPEHIVIPRPETLAKYGLTADEWLNILERQGWVCAICRKTPTTGRWNVDHKHILHYAKLPPEVRKSYVRGILCQWCNRSYMAKGMTLEKAKNMVEYLTR